MSGNIEAVFLKLGTRNIHLKRNQMTPPVFLPWKLSWLQSLSVKNKHPYFQPHMIGQRVLHGADMVTILPLFSSLDWLE